MAIVASQVSELRKQTDCAMMDCKKALEEANGDFTKAVEILRKKGVLKAAKKASRIAADGIIKVKVSDDNKQAVIVEVNSETDFVARDDSFQQFADDVAEVALSQGLKSVEALVNFKTESGKTIEEKRQELVGKLGENINLRRIEYMASDGLVGFYLHGNRIGVLVALKGGDNTLLKDIAMHIAASKPLVILPDQLPRELVDKERDIYIAQVMDSGKPRELAEKIVEGKLKKFTNEMSLYGQPFVKDADLSIEQLLKSKNANVEGFVRFELGEGIEKKKEDFAEEVMAQVKGV